MKPSCRQFNGSGCWQLTVIGEITVTLVDTIISVAKHSIHQHHNYSTVHVLTIDPPFKCPWSNKARKLVFIEV